MQENSRKYLKEQSVTGYNGTSEAKILVCVSILPIFLILYRASYLNRLLNKKYRTLQVIIQATIATTLLLATFLEFSFQEYLGSKLSLQNVVAALIGTLVIFDRYLALKYKQQYPQNEGGAAMGRVTKPLEECSRVQEDLQKDIQKDILKVVDKDAQNDTYKDLQKDTKEDIQNDIQKNMQKDTQNNPQKLISKDTQKAIQKDTQKYYEQDLQKSLQKNQQKFIQNGGEQGEQKEKIKESASVLIISWKRTITYFRTTLMLYTCFSILAVDFSVFPREFCKAETYGLGLMDGGTGAFIFSAALVSKTINIKDRQVLVSLVKRWVLLFSIGVLRTILTKALNYQEHASEYGSHWNFFTTLSVVLSLGPLLSSLVEQCRLKIQQAAFVAVILLCLGIMHLGTNKEKIQQLQLQQVDTNFIYQNLNGQISLLGYMCIYVLSFKLSSNIKSLIAQQDNICVNVDTIKGEKYYQAVKYYLFKRQSLLLVITFMFGITYYLNKLLIEETYQSLANPTYVLWILFSSFFTLLLCDTLGTLTLYHQFGVGQIWHQIFPPGPPSKERSTGQISVSSRSSGSGRSPRPPVALKKEEEMGKEVKGNRKLEGKEADTSLGGRSVEADMSLSRGQESSSNQKGIIDGRYYERDAGLQKWRVQGGDLMLVEQVNENLLALFMFSNVVTGLVNISMNTLTTPDYLAVLILGAYGFSICIFAHLLWVLKINMRF